MGRRYIVTIGAALGLSLSALAFCKPASAAQPVTFCSASAPNTQTNCAKLWSKVVVSGLSNAPITVKSSAGPLGMVQCFNPNSSQVYIQIFDNPSPILGTTVPDLSVPIAPNLTGGFVPPNLGVGFNSAIVVAATTTAKGSTAPTTTTGLDCNILFN